MGKFLFFIVIAAIAGYIYLRWTNKIPRKIKKEKIVEQWSALVEGANGEREKVITETIRIIEKLETPNIFVKRQELKPGAGFIRKKREFLIAEHKLLDTYDIYINARDYGRQLFVSWYLVEEPLNFMRRFKRNPVGAVISWPFVVMARVFLFWQTGSGKIMSPLNLFDLEELTAYVSTVHHALQESVKIMMENQNLDFTKIDNRTRGFLNIV